ncbi:MAG: N-acetyltransferase [Xanthobacteraceae bacterium]|nr:N-acetyltransferase [Xanthobacteraceae bacterium]
MPAEIRNNQALHRFELDGGGDVAVAYYALSPGIVTFTHTEVPYALQGQGIASRLIRAALEQVRAQGLKVIARCSFVSAYIARHPEFGDLLA